MRPYEAHPVEVQLVGTNFIEVLAAVDLSEGGVGVRVPYAFEGYDLNRQVDVILTLPGQRPFLARGRIRSKSARGGEHVFGVEFTYVADAGRPAIAAFVARMMLVGRGC